MKNEERLNLLNQSISQVIYHKRICAIMTHVRTIATLQRDFALNCAHKDNIIWDFFAADQEEILKQKIFHLMPDREQGMNVIRKMRDVLFQSTWAQRKYTNGNLQSSIIYVMVTDDQPEYREIASRAQHSVNFSCHPVIRTRKCINGGDSIGCCMIFIDEVGRVYQNWKEYVDGNVLPAGYMVAPIEGVYKLDENDQVSLLCCVTPANTTAQQVLETADKAAGVGGIAAAAVPLVGLALPIAAPIAAASAVVGLFAAAYSTFRSGYQLKDRRDHEQSIHVTDSEAMGSWLGVVGGTVAMSAAGATRLFANAAAAGKEIPYVATYMINGINISSIVLSGTGVANGLFDIFFKWKDDQPISSLDIVQLGASLVLFTHSVHNFQFASSIASQARDGTIQKYRSELSKRQRKMFDKISKETIRIRGETKGKIDIIRTVNEIPDTQYLNDFNKINKKLNQENVRPSFGPDGNIRLNDQISVDSTLLRYSVQHNIGENVLEKVTKSIPNSANQLLSGSGGLPNSTVETTAGVYITPVFMLQAAECGYKMMQLTSNLQDFEMVIRYMREDFVEPIVRFLMRLANTFVENTLDEITSVLRTFIAAETILWRLYLECKNNYRHSSLEFLESKAEEILDNIEQYFRSWRTTSDIQQLIKCPHCIGSYSIVNL